jgi:hypothetical protein
MSRFSMGDVPVFADIQNVEPVYRLILDLRTKAGKTSTSTQSILSNPSH